MKYEDNEYLQRVIDEIEGEFYNEYYKENIFKRFIRKIKSLFKRWS